MLQITSDSREMDFFRRPLFKRSATLFMQNIGTISEFSPTSTIWHHDSCILPRDIRPVTNNRWEQAGAPMVISIQPDLEEPNTRERQNRELTSWGQCINWCGISSTLPPTNQLRTYFALGNRGQAVSRRQRARICGRITFSRQNSRSFSPVCEVDSISKLSRRG